MSLFSHGVAAGIGYLLGTPQGRQRVNELSRQAAELGNRPEVVRLQERGKAVVAEKTEAVKQKVTARTSSAPTTGADPDAVGGNGDSAAPRRSLRLPAKLRNRRGDTPHFPPSTGTTPPESLGGTTVVDDSEAALRGAPTPRSDPPTPAGR